MCQSKLFDHLRAGVALYVCMCALPGKQKVWPSVAGAHTTETEPTDSRRGADTIVLAIKIPTCCNLHIFFQFSIIHDILQKSLA